MSENNNNSSSSGASGDSFFIHSDNIVPAKKPQHVQQRFRSGSVDYEERSNAAQGNRIALENARKEKLATRNTRVGLVIEKRKKELMAKELEQRSALEQNLVAAERNRLLNVERIVQRSHQEVELAKQRSNQIQEQLQKKNKHFKDTLERKSREALLRREKLMKIPRSRIMEWDDRLSAYGEELKCVPDEAASMIQQWFREISYKPVVRSFRKQGFCCNLITGLSFDEFTAKIQDKQLLSSVTCLLQRMAKSDLGSAKLAGKNCDRIFLTAYLIHFHASAIISGSGPLETALQEISTNLVEGFEAWLDNYRNTDSYKYLSECLALWRVFNQVFAEWKNRDRKGYLDELIQHFMDLDNLWQSVQGHHGAESEWKPRIEAEKVRLRAEIKKIGGAEGEKKLQDTINNISRPDMEKPSVIPQPMEKTEEKPLLPPQQPLQQQATTPSLNIDWQDMVSQFDSPAGMTNEQIAHELILNPKFELGSNVDPRMKQIQDIAKQALFDAVREDFDKKEYKKWLPMLLEDVRQQLLSMAPENSTLEKEIQGQLDLELIQQELDHNLFEIPKAINFVIQKMKQLCAPIRDPEVKQLEASSATQDLTTVFKDILGLLDKMKMDLANYRLSVLKPVLKNQIVDYEKKKFAETFSTHKDLKLTLEWLSNAAKEAHSVAAERNPENIDIKENKPKLVEIFIDAMLNLLTWTHPVAGPNCPETLKLDEQRLVEFQNEFQEITIVASLIMLLRNAFAQVRVEGTMMNQLRDHLFLLLDDPTTTIDHIKAQLVDTIEKQRQKQSKPSLNQNEKEMIENMVDKTLSYKDKVYLLLQRRILYLLRSYLITKKFRPEMLHRHGLDWVSHRLAQFADNFQRLVEHNRSVHAEYYDLLLADLV